MMNDVYIPAGIRIRGEHAGFPLSGEHPDFEFTCYRKDVIGEKIVQLMVDSYGILASVTPIMLLTAQGHGHTFVVCGSPGTEVYTEMDEQLRRFRG
jgi:hypothetical protein